MTVSWLDPSAWWGLLALAIPIAIHLLTRQQTRRIPFPTLRFLRPTRLAAWRRRSIHDWPLLVVRLFILGATTAAVAGPVIISAARQAQWRSRVVRAFVIAPSSSSGAPMLDAVVTEEARGTFASAVIRPATHLADGLRDAIDWLERQPPAAREVVIMGDLKDGTLAEPDLSLVPASAGLRFLPTPDVRTEPAIVDSPFGRTTLLADRTQVMYRDAIETSAAPISVRASPADQRFVQMARDAIVTRGIPGDRALVRRVLVVFEGGDASDVRVQDPAQAGWMREALARLPGMSGGQAGDTLVVRVARPADDVEAAHAIDRIARAAFAEDLRALEPRSIPAATLARWSRPSQPDLNTPVSDEGDRRWFWSIALVFIALEAFARRTKPALADAPPLEDRHVA